MPVPDRRRSHDPLYYAEYMGGSPSEVSSLHHGNTSDYNAGSYSTANSSSGCDSTVAI